jgi:hypothetical protein
LDARTEFLYSQYLLVPTSQRFAFFQPLTEALLQRGVPEVVKNEVNVKGKKRKKTQSLSSQPAPSTLTQSPSLSQSSQFRSYYHDAFWLKQV